MNWRSLQAGSKVQGNPAYLEYTERVHKCFVNVKKALTIRWFRVASANPATPTIRFTKLLKGLVNFLNHFNCLCQLWPILLL